MNLDVFNLRQLQDTKAFLAMCEKKGVTREQATAELEAEIQRRTPAVPTEVSHGKVPSKPCPTDGCDGVMRMESKGRETIWHCLACQYSEYIGYRLRGKK